MCSRENDRAAASWYFDTTLLIALMLSVFAILFGTRVIDATEHHPGMVVAIAAESLFKLVALLLVGVFALTTLDGAKAIADDVAAVARDLRQPSMFFAQALTSMFAFFCLPRHVPHRRGRMRRRRRRAPRTLVVRRLPRAAQHRGHSHRRRHVATRRRRTRRAEHRCLVLWLPLSAGHEWLALLAYLGGFSAATGMVIVASVALSTMISNDLVLPMLVALAWHRHGS